MKKGIHPEYKMVAVRDNTSDKTFLTRSTKLNGPKIQHEGQEYPGIIVEVSAYSHPFFTGKQRFVDTAGRVEKFNQRFKGLPSRRKKD